MIIRKAKNWKGKSEKKVNTKKFKEQEKGEKRNETDRAKHPGGLFPSSAAAKEAHNGNLCKLASNQKYSMDGFWTYPVLMVCAMSLKSPRRNVLNRKNHQGADAKDDIGAKVIVCPLIRHGLQIRIFLRDHHNICHCYILFFPQEKIPSSWV